MIEVPDHSVETGKCFQDVPLSYTPRLLIARRSLGPKGGTKLFVDLGPPWIPSAKLKAWVTVNAHFGSLPRLRYLSFKNIIPTGNGLYC